MKRDMDLIRKILLYIEENIYPHNPGEVKIEGSSQYEVAYHLKLLDDAGLIFANDVSDSSGPDFIVLGLTWQGHEFIEAARDNKRWEKAKTTILKKVGSLSFSLLNEFLVKLMTSQLGLPS